MRRRLTPHDHPERSRLSVGDTVRWVAPLHYFVRCRERGFTDAMSCERYNPRSETSTDEQAQR
jgi:hypothetical protein